MNLPCAALIQEFRGFPKLGAPDYRVIDQKKAFVLYQVMDRYQFHLGNQVPFALDRGHKGTGPGRGIFDKGP